MSNIFIPFFCLISTIANCQLTIETYNLGDSLINLQINEGHIDWLISDKKTPNDYTDDHIMITERNGLGQNTIQRSFEVVNANVDGSIVNYIVKIHDGTTFTISFWIHRNNSLPMVCYRYNDKYIIYHGNISY